MTDEAIFQRVILDMNVDYGARRGTIFKKKITESWAYIHWRKYFNAHKYDIRQQPSDLTAYKFTRHMMELDLIEVDDNKMDEQIKRLLFKYKDERL